MSQSASFIILVDEKTLNGSEDDRELIKVFGLNNLRFIPWNSSEMNNIDSSVLLRSPYSYIDNP